MKLFIVHYHLRPGGVRRVIELATPHLLRTLGAEWRSVRLVVGERPGEAWLRAFRRAAAPARVEVCVETALGYADGKTSAVRVREALAAAVAGDGLVWAHNLALGRNLFLSRELARLCAARRLRLVAHHHDWWCDHRWVRWPEMRRAGFRTLRAVAEAVLPGAAHAAINQADARLLGCDFPGSAHWLPNLVERAHMKVRRRRASPVWLMPCRVLRRKNIAEALLLTRWLRPGTRLVITGSADESDERAYAETLRRAAREEGWAVEFGAVAERSGASVSEALAECEAVVFTSIQEGFGLPPLEAATAGLPLLMRRVPLVAPDLARFGFRFPQSYDDVQIAPELFDWRAEVRRQSESFRAWRRRLPRAVQSLAGTPALLACRGAQPIAFSRLTLAAQLEVLRRPLHDSWRRCVPLNPWLAEWRERAARGRLQASAWPAGADRWLSGAAFARRFVQIAQTAWRGDAAAAQERIIRARLASEHLFPLLLAP